MTTSKSTLSSTASANRNPSSWDPQDDVLLRHLKEVKKLGWKEIAQYFNNRTPNACQFRWRRLKSGNLKSKSVATDPSASSTTPMPEDITATSQSIPIPTPLKSGTTATATANNNNNHQNSYSSSPFSVPAGAVTTAVTTTAAAAAAAAAAANSAYNTPSSGADKFVKPRSYSHAAPLLQTTIPSVDNSAVEENLGLIPKVIVRSRRGSMIQPTSSNLTAALHTTLTTSKTRKNSFSSRSRRSSFNLPPAEKRLPIASAVSTPSRRSSMVMAPTSMSSIARRESFNTNNPTSRRGSIIAFRRESAVHMAEERRSSTSCFTDLPSRTTSYLSSSFPVHSTTTTPLQHSTSDLSAVGQQTWSLEEDQLLNQRQQKHLTMDELSILLPHRSEQEIQWRIEALNNNRVGKDDGSNGNSNGNGNSNSHNNKNNNQHNANSSSSGTASPLTSPGRSFTEETAIEDEEETHRSNNHDNDHREHSESERSEQSENFHSHHPFHSRGNRSPIISTDSPPFNERDQSPVFSASSGKERSPTVSDGTTRSNTLMNTSGFKYVLPSQAHHPHSVATATPQATQLPSLNSIFKNIL